MFFTKACDPEGNLPCNCVHAGQTGTFIHELDIFSDCAGALPPELRQYPSVCNRRESGRETPLDFFGPLLSCKALRLKSPGSSGPYLSWHPPVTHDVEEDRRREAERVHAVEHAAVAFYHGAPILDAAIALDG